MKEVVDGSAIKKLMKSKEPVAIFYYAAWCGHCKVMHEPWDELEKDQKNVKFVKMESENIPDELGISGYPHFVYVKDGKVQSVTSGEMSKDDLKTKLLGGSLVFANGGRRRRTRRLRRTRRKTAH